MEFYVIEGIPVWLRNRGDQDVAEEIIKQDFYGLRELAKNGFEPQVIVDIGAHVGTFAAFAHTLWPYAKIVCFEPVTENFDVLSRNASFAELYNYAVRYDEATTFVTTKDATGGGFVASKADVERLSDLKHKWDGFNYEPMCDVETVTLEEILQEQGVEYIDLLKLDCELSEFNIIQGMESDTIRNTRMVVGEYHCEGGFPEFKAEAEKRFNHLSFHAPNTSRDPIGGFYSRLRQSETVIDVEGNMVSA